MRIQYQLHSTGLLPLCEVIIIGNRRRIPVRAVVDSGATHPIFPEIAATDAEIDLTRGRPYPITFGGSNTPGRLIETYVELQRARFRLEMVFVPEVRLGYALLGRKTFFNQFREVAFVEKVRPPFLELRE